MRPQDTAMRTARRYVVHGRVQGVGYRWFAERAARALHVGGFARNLDDGTVEVVACGRPEDVARFAAELRRGPGGGWVTALEEGPAADADADRTDFDIRV